MQTEVHPRSVFEPLDRDAAPLVSRIFRFSVRA